MIVRPIEDPEKCPPAWEILWNDPLDDDEYAKESSKNPSAKKTKKPELYINNEKRRTAYYFSEKAVNKFLKVAPKRASTPINHHVSPSFVLFICVALHFRRTA